MEPYQYYEQNFGLRLLPEYPHTINSYPTDDTPLYWQMPRSFLGDRVASYNGFLRFQVSNTDDNILKGSMRPSERHFTRFPLVVLMGNNRLILEYYPEHKIPENGRYKVKLREGRIVLFMKPKVGYHRWTYPLRVRLKRHKT